MSLSTQAGQATQTVWVPPRACQCTPRHRPFPPPPPPAPAGPDAPCPLHTENSQLHPTSEGDRGSPSPAAPRAHVLTTQQVRTPAQPREEEPAGSLGISPGTPRPGGQAAAPNTLPPPALPLPLPQEARTRDAGPEGHCLSTALPLPGGITNSSPRSPGPAAQQLPLHCPPPVSQEHPASSDRGPAPLPTLPRPVRSGSGRGR